jgi:hypothetical protein
VRWLREDCIQEDPISQHRQEPHPSRSTNGYVHQLTSTGPQGEDGRSQREDGNKEPLQVWTIDKVPHFVLECNFVKNTPYVERSEEDNIPFWSHTPYHLEYVFVMEEHLELILHYIYWSKRFQFFFGEAAFYYKNPGMEALGSE